MKKTLAEISVLDAAYYLFVFFAVFLNTIGFGFSSRTYTVLMALLAIASTVRVIVMRVDYRDIIISLFMIILCVSISMKTGKYTIALSALLIVTAYDVDVITILKVYLAAKVMGLLWILFSVITGINTVSVVQHYRMITGEYETRVKISGIPGNAMQLSICCVMVLYMTVNFKRINWWCVIALLSLSVFTYCTVTRSLTGVIMSFFSVVLYAVMSSDTIISRGICRVSPLLPIVISVTMLFIGYHYNSNAIYSFLNNLSTGRIAYDHYYLTEYGISAFGNDYTSMIEDGFFDDSYVYMPVVFGYVFTVIIIASVTVSLVKLVRVNSTRGVSLICLIMFFLIYSVAESVFPSCVANPALFVLVGTLFHRSALGSDDSLSPRGVSAAKSSTRCF